MGGDSHCQKCETSVTDDVWMRWSEFASIEAWGVWVEYVAASVEGVANHLSLPWRRPSIDCYWSSTLVHVGYSFDQCSKLQPQLHMNFSQPHQSHEPGHLD